MQNKKVSRGPFIIDPIHRFMSVICENTKKNGYPCNTWLGEIELTRPNITKQHCSVCNITYQHIVDDDGDVVYRTTTDVTLQDQMTAKTRIK